MDVSMMGVWGIVGIVYGHGTWGNGEMGRMVWVGMLKCLYRGAGRLLGVFR